jgi:hypothetical protein
VEKGATFEAAISHFEDITVIGASTVITLARAIDFGASVGAISIGETRTFYGVEAKVYPVGPQAPKHIAGFSLLGGYQEVDYGRTDVNVGYYGLEVFVTAPSKQLYIQPLFRVARIHDLDDNGVDPVTSFEGMISFFNLLEGSKATRVSVGVGKTTDSGPTTITGSLAYLIW